MKKLFLVVLAAGLFAACGNGNKEADETATNDSIPAQDEVVMDQDQPAEEAAPVAEATTTETNNTAKTTVKEEAQNKAEEVAKEAINVAGDAAKDEVKELPKRKRR